MSSAGHGKMLSCFLQDPRERRKRSRSRRGHSSRSRAQMDDTSSSGMSSEDGRPRPSKGTPRIPIDSVSLPYLIDRYLSLSS